MFRLPADDQRHVIYGKTGSGKTVAGLWALEKRSFDRKPWIIFDTKRDSHIAKIPRLEEIDFRRNAPTKPGLYVVRPMPGDDFEGLLWSIWENESTGVFIDESYMIPRFSKAHDALQTQGRSKDIPIISLTQRPSWLSRFVMDSCDFHQVFFVQRPADIQTIREWVPGSAVPSRQDHTSVYYDVPDITLTKLSPVPPISEILTRFNDKMPRRAKLMRGWLNNAGAG